MTGDQLLDRAQDSNLDFLEVNVILFLVFLLLRNGKLEQAI